MDLYSVLRLANVMDIETLPAAPVRIAACHWAPRLASAANSEGVSCNMAPISVHGLGGRDTDDVMSAKSREGLRSGDGFSL